MIIPVPWSSWVVLPPRSEGAGPVASMVTTSGRIFCTIAGMDVPPASAGPGATSLIVDVLGVRTAKVMAAPTPPPIRATTTTRTSRRSAVDRPTGLGAGTDGSADHGGLAASTGADGHAPGPAGGTEGGGGTESAASGRSHGRTPCSDGSNAVVARSPSPPLSCWSTVSHSCRGLDWVLALRRRCRATLALAQDRYLPCANASQGRAFSAPPQQDRPDSKTLPRTAKVPLFGPTFSLGQNAR